MSDECIPDDGWPPRRQANWALLLLFLAYIVAFIDRIILAILIRPVSTDLQLNDMQFALVGGVAFSLFYVTAGLPIGWLVDRYPRRTIVAVGVAIWSLATIGTALAATFGWLFLSRVGVGIGEAALAPAAYSLIADYFPPERRGRAVAIYTLGVSLGASIAYFVGGQLIGFASQAGGIALPLFGDLAAWRFVFVAVGLPGLLLALLTLTMREPPRRGDKLEERIEKGAFVHFIRRNRGVSATYFLGYSFINLSFAGFMLWGPALFERVHGMGPADIGVPLALIFLIPTILGQWFGAAVTDRMVARGHADAPFLTGAACAVLLVPTAIAMPLLADTKLAFAALALLVFLVCASVGHHAVVAAAVAPNRMRGLYVASFFFVQNILGQAIVALVTAFLTDTVFGSPDSLGKSMAIVGGAGAVGGCALLLLGRGMLRRASAENRQLSST
ncbi:MFS transporter [Croceicoccus estronivorus]|uniref:MFS transporter n=1 Tax=Croceicoccus estronivorus TaxID=1172626 RepID=UPI001478482B|nr:MFS transporter [Croceicoccus estronivorus]